MSRCKRDRQIYKKTKSRITTGWDILQHYFIFLQMAVFLARTPNLITSSATTQPNTTKLVEILKGIIALIY